MTKSSFGEKWLLLRPQTMIIAFKFKFKISHMAYKTEVQEIINKTED